MRSPATTKGNLCKQVLLRGLRGKKSLNMQIWFVEQSIDQATELCNTLKRICSQVVYFIESNEKGMTKYGPLAFFV